MARGPRALRVVENQPTAQRARERLRTWSDCLRGQRGARSTPRRWPRLLFNVAAPDWRLRLRNAVVEAFKFHGARPARASPRGEPADRPQSTYALADLACLSSWPTRGALHPTPLAEALLHRHRHKWAASIVKHRDYICRIRCRTACARSDAEQDRRGFHTPRRFPPPVLLGIPGGLAGFLAFFAFITGPLYRPSHRRTSGRPDAAAQDRGENIARTPHKRYRCHDWARHKRATTNVPRYR